MKVWPMADGQHGSSGHTWIFPVRLLESYWRGKEEVRAIFRVWVLKQVPFGTNGLAFTLWLIVIGKIGCHVQL